MTEGLRERDRIRDTFSHYLTREVVNRLLESKDGLQLGGENREITMIMSDLRGFTALTSSMPPQQVLAFLNRYLGKMVEILIDYQGTIDEIIGDGILAFFGVLNLWTTTPLTLWLAPSRCKLPWTRLIPLMKQMAFHGLTWALL